MSPSAAAGPNIAGFKTGARAYVLKLLFTAFRLTDFTATYESCALPGRHFPQVGSYESNTTPAT